MCFSGELERGFSEKSRLSNVPKRQPFTEPTTMPETKYF